MEQAVVFRNVHAVGKTAGVHCAVGGNIDGAAVPGLAQDRGILQGQFLTIGGKYFTFYLKIKRFRTPAALIISIHGAANWPSFQMNLSRWNSLADEHGFIVVYPAGEGGGPVGKGAVVNRGHRGARLDEAGGFLQYLPAGLVDLDRPGGRCGAKAVHLRLVAVVPQEAETDVGKDDVAALQEPFTAAQDGGGRMEPARAAGPVKAGRVKGVFPKADLARDHLRLEHEEARQPVVASLDHGREDVRAQLGLAHSFPQQGGDNVFHKVMVPAPGLFNQGQFFPVLHGAQAQ